MTRALLTGLFGAGCLGLTACVVEPPPPPVPPPAPVVVAPPVMVPAAVPAVGPMAEPSLPPEPRPRVWHPRCPPGYHLGPAESRCWPN